MRTRCGRPSPARLAASARRILPLAGLLVLLPAEIGSAPDRGPGPAPPPVFGLTPTEAELWAEQGIDRPSPDLAGQADVRRAGGVTQLHVAVILVDFPDFSGDRLLHTPEHYERLLFSRGEIPTGSAAEFLSASSRGRLELTGEVRGWFTVSEERNEYSNGQGGIGWYPKNSQRLAEEAMFLADSTINYAHFDNEGPDGVPDSGDDDQRVDGVIIVHAGPGRIGGASTPDDFLSLHWWIPQPLPVDGVFGRFFTLNPEDGNIGVFVHEIGHVLGLPDLYDTNGGGSLGLGAWSIMSGGWLLDDGRRPSDFDAWSKSELGFADVTFIQSNQKGVVIPPTASSGAVYRLWSQGVLGQEYFLLENRRRQGLDQALPGEGLLIYHVDEKISSNDFPNHYKVALEQADGLFELENRFGAASPGDEGDPYRAGDVFGRYTNPSSFDYAGEDTYVTVFGIGAPDSLGAVTADINVEPGPIVEVMDVTLIELEGADGDGLIEAGELAGVVPRIAVSRRIARGTVLRAFSADPVGELLDTEVLIGDLPAGLTFELSDPIRIQIASEVPQDPYGLRLDLELEWQDDPSRIVPLELGVGEMVGRSDDFESLDHGWTHEKTRRNGVDQWRYGPEFGVGGSSGFRNGTLSGGRLRGADAALVSPLILLPPGAQLAFDHSVDIVSPDPGVALGGGVVEISVNGGDWQSAVPAGGYPAIFRGERLDWQLRPVYSGVIDEGAFHTAYVDLSSYGGSIRIRFHFHSEQESSFGQGWRIDNVRVLQDITSVTVLSVESVIEGDDVRLSWRLGDPLPSSLRWRRGTEPGTGVAVGEGWMRGAAEGSVLDPGGARTLPASYWLEARGRDGEIDRWGPWRVAGARVTRPWHVHANPSRGALSFTWGVTLPEGAALEIFDVRGALVFRSPLERDPGNLAWDGSDGSGRSVGPGVYFARIRNAALEPIRVVILP